MSVNIPTLEPITSSLNRMGMKVALSTLSSGAQHFHISAPDPQSSLVLAIPIAIGDNSGIAHVLEHLLLTGVKEPGGDSLFFRTRASSSAVDMNAITNSRYLAVHFTCCDAEEYFSLLKTFLNALFEPSWSNVQLEREIATITNEMEGALSDSNFNWQLKTYQSIFVKGSAQYNPGGDPSCIAGVDQEGLMKFWKDHFSPNNLIAISYGSQGSELISRQLSSELSRFGCGHEIKITPPKPTEVPRTLHWFGSPSREFVGRSASALLIGSNASEGADLDVTLIRSFIHQYDVHIVEALEKRGLDVQGVPDVKQIDGDSILLVLFKNSDTSSSKEIWEQIANICELIIEKLSRSELTRLVYEALAHYFTLGNNKFGTGVAASLELLNAACGSFFGSPKHEGIADINTKIDKYQDRSSWIHLIKKNIRMNGSQSLVVYDQSASSRESQLSNLDRHGRTVHEEPRLREIRNRAGGAEISYLRQELISEVQENWLVPKVATHKQSTIVHYRLPRPWISSVKLTIPLPNNLVDQIGPSHQFLMPGFQTQQAQISVTAAKVSGVPAYRLYFSLLSTGDVSEMLKRLQFLCSPLWLERLVQGVDQSHKSGDGVRNSLPLHKLAIYRGASRVSRIANVKLALAGYGETANARSPEWDLQLEQYAALDAQPRSILFMDSAFEETEVDIGVSDVHPISADDIDFGDSPAIGLLAETDRRETIPGSLNYCARVWTLDKQFGTSAEEDAIPHIFSALLTNLYLEPVIRGERSAYAASADIDPELGMLAMFSYRDPNSRQTDAFFLHAFEQVIAGGYTALAFEQSKRRAISRLQIKGSYDQRCERQFDQLVRGYGPDYFDALTNAIILIELPVFQKTLSGYFKNSMTAEYALIGSAGATGE